MDRRAIACFDRGNYTLIFVAGQGWQGFVDHKWSQKCLCTPFAVLDDVAAWQRHPMLPRLRACAIGRSRLQGSVLRAALRTDDN
jgi:hypothetical protein